MEKNKSFFENGEANQWFHRNRKGLECKDSDKPIQLLLEWLQPYRERIGDVLEIGCGSGHRLNQIEESLSATAYGIEPSRDAVEYIRSTFPSKKAEVGFGDDVPLNRKFDLVHLGFFLYLVDREDFLKCVSEADRLLNFGGFLSIIDFETPFPYSNSYSHQPGVFSHKLNNAKVFEASGLYSVINKFHFSHNDFYFDTDINERVSLTLLYKETEVFDGIQKNR